MLCDLCQNIQFKQYLELGKEEKLYLLSYCEEWSPDEPDEYSLEEALNDDLGLIGPQSFYFNHHNLELLQKAATDGCHFCYQIFFGLLQTSDVNYGSEDSDDRLYLALLAPDLDVPDPEHHYLGDLDVRWGEESLGKLRFKNLNDFAKFVPNSQDMEYNSSTGSPTNLDLAASWLHDFWKSTRFLTKLDNLELRKKAVDQSTFPKTFNDAIVVCWHLGIRYLWIDSLCIIQDCGSDKRTQISRMGDIYSNALLTISAAVGEDSHAGLFIERDSRQTYPCPLNLQYPKEDGVTTKGTFLVCHDWYTPEPAYLDKRGWTFQEKYLSPRALCFSKKGIFWTCASKTASEGLPMGLIPMSDKSDFDKYIRIDAARSSSNQVHMRQRFEWWYQAMEVYSYRIFTNESDRLPALAGLAAKFQFPDDEFWYGLWKSDVAYGLAWRISARGRDNATEVSVTSPRPSWSWASRPGKIITYAENEREGMVLENHNSIFSKNGKPDSLPVTFFEILCENPSPAAPHLTPSSAPLSLVLRGLIKKIIPARSSLAYDSVAYLNRGSLSLFHYTICPKTRTCKQFLTSAFYDEPVTKGDIMYCLPLTLLTSSKHTDAKSSAQEAFRGCSIEELISLQTILWENGGHTLSEMTWCAGPISRRRMGERDEISCLILKQVDAGARFRRIGYLVVCEGHLFDGLPPTTLEII